MTASNNAKCSIRPAMKYRAYLLRLTGPKLFILAAAGFASLVFLFAGARCLLIPEVYRPWQLSRGGSFQNFDKFVTTLKSTNDPLSAFIWSQLANITRINLTKYPNPTIDRQNLQNAVADDIDSNLRTESLYSETRFRSVTLSPQLREVAAEASGDAPSPEINRLLLDEAFPHQLPERGDAAQLLLSTLRASCERQTLQTEFAPPFGRMGRAITWTQALAAPLYFAVITSLMSFRLLRKRENIAFPDKLAYNHQLEAFEIRFVNLDASDISNLRIRAFFRKRISRANDELIRDMMFPVTLSMAFEPYTESMMVVAFRTIPPTNEGVALTTERENAISLDTLDDLSSFIITVSATAVDSGETVVARKIYKFTDIVIGQYRDVEADLPANTYGDPQNCQHRSYEHFNTIDGLNMPANEWRQKHGRQGMASIDIAGAHRIIRFPNEGNAEKHIKNILASSGIFR